MTVKVVTFVSTLMKLAHELGHGVHALTRNLSRVRD